MNLLIIDDERIILENVYAQLKEMKLGMERIDLAGSTGEARKRMADCHYDIFLCDIVMPGEDGISFAKWVLEREPEVKIIFLTAYADVKYMKEAISMQSFDYVLQPVSSAELKGVIERAIAQIRIEKRNRELMQSGAFFQSYEEDILEIGVLKYLEGQSEQHSYSDRLKSRYHIDQRRKTLYLPVKVEVLESRKQIEKLENPLQRLVYRNVLDEVLYPLHISSIVLLEEKSTDFIAILHWDEEMSCEKSLILEKLECFRVLSYRVLLTNLALYCGNIGEEGSLEGCLNALNELQKDNVRRESRVFAAKTGEPDAGSHSFELQVNTWKKLLEQDQFGSFRDSILAYLDRDGSHRRMNAASMMRLHQSVTQLLLLYLVNHQIGSDRIFDAELPYITWMSAGQRLDLFMEALDHITGRLQELVGNKKSRDVVQETIKYIQKNLDRDVSVSEIAEFVGMNSEYLTKLFKKETGYNLKKYIVNEKMESAKMLLTTTALPVTLISDHVGYGNYSNFTRSFKQLVGCTPVEYRKAAENQKMQQ